VSGHTLKTKDIPFDLASVMPEHILRQLDTDYFEIGYTGLDRKPKTMAWRGLDFHAMGKKHLGDIVANTR
jgi:hypothetical protein